MNPSDEAAELYRAFVKRPASVPYPPLEPLGGVYKSAPEDFIVEEQSLYDPDGRPGHRYLWVEKRNISTAELVRLIARDLGIEVNTIGTAGLKDSLAVTRQWVSVPDRVDLDLLTGEGYAVKETYQNSRKLKTGELVGNRFRIIVRGANRVSALPERLPNYFGAQRFGTKEDTHEKGFERLRSGYADRSRLTRLELSAAQSALFNAYLAKRVDDNVWQTVIDGDPLIRRRSGGTYFGSDRQDATDRGIAIIAGPMFGPRMEPSSGEARQRELDALAAAKVDEGQFARLERITPGTRRPLWIELEHSSARETEPGQVELRFSLPAGAYASVVLAALGVQHA
ncbi:MAG: tRNA pseudouridine(13) synthase TruD [Myxococcota bacterium]